VSAGLKRPEVKRGELLAVGCRWRNGGVAPCLPGGYPAITMKDARAGIAGVFVDEDLDVRTLPVGPPDKAAAVTREAQSVAQDSRPLTGWALPPANILEAGNIHRLGFGRHAHGDSEDRAAPGRRRR